MTCSTLGQRAPPHRRARARVPPPSLAAWPRGAQGSGWVLSSPLPQGTSSPAPSRNQPDCGSPGSLQSPPGATACPPPRPSLTLPAVICPDPPHTAFFLLLTPEIQQSPLAFSHSPISNPRANAFDSSFKTYPEPIHRLTRPASPNYRQSLQTFWVLLAPYEEAVTQMLVWSCAGTPTGSCHTRPAHLQ